jgi:anti-sigma regulatory factor (Ser/Thr protein kinase)
MLPRQEISQDDSFQTLCLPATLESVAPLSKFIVDRALSAGVLQKRLFELELVLEELLTNAAIHAYRQEDRADSWIKVGIDCTRPDRLQIRVDDAGAPFDIMAHPTPEVTSALEDRQVGGLGVHLVRQIAVNARYEIMGGNVNRFSFELPAT